MTANTPDSPMGEREKHDWIKSTLGHGNNMCRRCYITDLEAAAIEARNGN